MKHKPMPYIRALYIACLMVGGGSLLIVFAWAVVWLAQIR